MARSLTTQQTLRDAARLRFCYLCGKAFAASDQTNSDHVPPTKLFAKADRTPPLILPTHSACNRSRSVEDQAIGQIVGVLHGRQVNRQHNKLRVMAGRSSDGAVQVLAMRFDIKGAIRRWIRGFHAALYNEYLPDLSEGAVFATYPPMPEATHSGGRVAYEPVAPAFSMFAAELRKNRAVGSLDQIIAYNGKCRYECVWVQADDGRWICVYGLDVYNWIDLGDRNQPPRSCVGCYLRPTGGVPMGASTGTRLVFDLTANSPLDPFAV